MCHFILSSYHHIIIMAGQGREYYVEQNEQNKYTRIYLRHIILFSVCIPQFSSWSVFVTKNLNLWIYLEDTSQVKEKLHGKLVGCLQTRFMDSWEASAGPSLSIQQVDQGLTAA